MNKMTTKVRVYWSNPDIPQVSLNLSKIMSAGPIVPERIVELDEKGEETSQEYGVFWDVDIQKY